MSVKDKFISEADRQEYYDLIGEVYFKEHSDPKDFDEVHKKLDDFRNKLALKYGYDRSNHGIDIENGKIVRLHP